MGGTDGKITYSDIYKGLWKCRDFELEHYWQRAVFLTAFLLACYAGYGTFIVSCATAEKLAFPFLMVNGIAFAICVIGLLLSLLWIMMAKGSKTWYEHYESAINAFVNRYREYGDVFEGDTSTVAGFKIADVEDFKREKISSWLWNAYGGAYSVSRINVALGHLSTLIWLGLMLLHITIGKAGIASFDEMKGLFRALMNPTAMMVGSVMLLLAFWVYVRLVLRSSYHEDN